VRVARRGDRGDRSCACAWLAGRRARRGHCFAGYDFNPLRGAYNRVAADATAFAHRDARFCLKVSSGDRGWVERTWARLAPLSTGGVYPNFAEPQRDRWDPAYHLGNRERLLAVRAAYDPSGLWSAPPTPPSSTPTP